MTVLRNLFFGLLLLAILAVSAVVLLANRGSPPLPSVALSEPGDADAWERGYRALVEGDARTALTHLRRVPKDHPEYARAMRYCGWNLLARRLHRPKDAVAYVHESLRHDPFDGNGWQDLARVYLRAAFSFDDV